LHELLPEAARFAVLVNPDSPLTKSADHRPAGCGFVHWAGTRGFRRQDQ
jgi:hypothetical protein